MFFCAVPYRYLLISSITFLFLGGTVTPSAGYPRESIMSIFAPEGSPSSLLTAFSSNQPYMHVPRPSSAAWSAICSHAMATSMRLNWTPRNSPPRDALYRERSVITVMRTGAREAKELLE